MESLVCRYSKRTVWLMGLNATLGSFIFGYNLGVMTSFRDSLSYYYDWGSNEDLYFSLFFPLMALGAMFGALGAGGISNKLGRRRALIIQDLTIIVGCGLVVIPWTPFFPLSRFVCGCAVGGFASIVPNYIKEVSPTEMYGRVGSLVQLLITFGIAVSYAFALGLPTGTIADSDGKYFWILMYAFQGFIAVLQILIFTFCYKNEPSEWLLQMNYRESAILALREIYYEEEANAILDRMENPVHPTEFTVQETRHLGYSELLCCRRSSSKMMRLGVFLNIFQQFVGINAILSYLTDIFNELNDDTFISRVLTLVGGVINMSTAVLVFPLIGRVGRKTLFLVSNTGIILSMIGTALLSGPFSYVGYVPSMVLIMIYVISFGIGIGPICWLYCGEILTTKAISICTGVNWFGSFLNILVYPFMKSALGLPVTLSVYGTVSVISVVYIFFDVFETRGLTNQEINNKLWNRAK